MAAVTLTVQR